VTDQQEDSTLYTVVRNAEDQYSIWPANLSLPSGWSIVGPTGDRSVCLDQIDQMWTDITPKSARKGSRVGHA
jgi:MbtH protein